MDFYNSSLYIYKFKFPIKTNYLSEIESYAKKINKKYIIINREFAKFLKKTDYEKKLEEKKKKEIQSQINREKQFQANKKITKSISNNNMLLNIMSQSKIFVKYLNNLKQSRNNKIAVKYSSINKDNNNNSNSVLKNKKVASYTFIIF